MNYMPVKIELEEVGGILPSMRGMKLPKKAESDSYGSQMRHNLVLGSTDAKLAGNLELLLK